VKNSSFLKQGLGKRDTKHGKLDLPVYKGSAMKRLKHRFAEGGSVKPDKPREDEPTGKALKDFTEQREAQRIEAKRKKAPTTKTEMGDTFKKGGAVKKRKFSAGDKERILQALEAAKKLGAKEVIAKVAPMLQGQGGPPPGGMPPGPPPGGGMGMPPGGMPPGPPPGGGMGVPPGPPPGGMPPGPPPQGMKKGGKVKAKKKWVPPWIKKKGGKPFARGGQVGGRGRGDGCAVKGHTRGRMV